jgi:lysophospholipase L1-like esterase
LRSPNEGQALKISEPRPELLNRFERHERWILLVFFATSYLVFDLIAGSLLIPVLPRRFHPYYHHDLKTYQHYKDEKWGTHRYALITNSLGFKDSSPREIELETDKRRIVFIGDSFTEGVGFAYEETYVGLVDAALDSENFDVLNAGVASYCPLLYHLKIRYLLEEVGLRFDELYVFVDISDIQDEIVYRDFKPSAFPLHRYIDVFLKGHSYTYNALRNNYAMLYDIRAFFGGVEEVMQPDVYTYSRARWTYDDEVFEQWGRRGLTAAKLHMDELIEMCRMYGVEVVVAVYPWPDQLRGDRGASLQEKAWREFAAGKDVDFINYFPIFSQVGADEASERYFIPGDVHWNAEGHKLIAETVKQRFMVVGAGNPND